MEHNYHTGGRQGGAALEGLFNTSVAARRRSTKMWLSATVPELNSSLVITSTLSPPGWCPLQMRRRLLEYLQISETGERLPGLACTVIGQTYGKWAAPWTGHSDWAGVPQQGPSQNNHGCGFSLWFYTVAKRQTLCNGFVWVLDPDVCFALITVCYNNLSLSHFTRSVTLSSEPRHEAMKCL